MVQSNAVQIEYGDYASAYADNAPLFALCQREANNPETLRFIESLHGSRRFRFNISFWWNNFMGSYWAAPQKKWASYEWCIGKTDVYHSIGETYWGIKERTKNNVGIMQAVWSDLDFYDVPQYANYSPEEMADLILDFTCRKYPQLPAPWILCSGQGLWLCWTLRSPLHSNRGEEVAWYSRWDCVMKAVYADFKPFGADRKAIDASRVTRVPGTINSKALARGLNPVVRILHPAQGSVDFESLCNTFLPEDRESSHKKLVNARAFANAVKKSLSLSPVGKVVHLRTLRYLRYNNDVIADLYRYAEILREKGELEGKRNFLTHAIMDYKCLIQAFEPEKFDEEGLKTAREIDANWAATEFSISHLSTLKRKYIEDYTNPRPDGGTNLYKFYKDALIESLKISLDVQKDMKVLRVVTPEEKREKERMRSERRRRKDGCLPREEYLAVREAFRAKIQAICEEEGISESTCRRRHPELWEAAKAKRKERAEVKAAKIKAKADAQPKAKAMAEAETPVALPVMQDTQNQTKQSHDKIIDITGIARNIINCATLEKNPPANRIWQCPSVGGNVEKCNGSVRDKHNNPDCTCSDLDLDSWQKEQDCFYADVSLEELSALSVLPVPAVEAMPWDVYLALSLDPEILVPVLPEGMCCVPGECVDCPARDIPGGCPVAQAYQRLQSQSPQKKARRSRRDRLESDKDKSRSRFWGVEPVKRTRPEYLPLEYSYEQLASRGVRSVARVTRGKYSTVLSLRELADLHAGGERADMTLAFVNWRTSEGFVYARRFRKRVEKILKAFPAEERAQRDLDVSIALDDWEKARAELKSAKVALELATVFDGKEEIEAARTQLKEIKLKVRKCREALRRISTPDLPGVQ